LTINKYMNILIEHDENGIYPDKIFKKNESMGIIKM
jgi:hypothetical protein